ncbi:MAG: DUF4116 domain-containing protein [Legionella sp.]|nr:DUF4116 domain-containing protein [Legionella sp.]
MPNDIVQPTVINMGGASASGKTTLSRKLKIALLAGGKSCEIVANDFYYKLFLKSSAQYKKIETDLKAEGLITDKQTPAEQKTQINRRYVETGKFDLYKSFNTKLMAHDLAKLNKGEAVKKGIYSFETHRYSDYKTIKPAQYIILEGLYGANNEIFDDEFKTLSVFVSTSSVLTIKERRIARDIAERPDEPDPKKRDPAKETLSVIRRLNKDVWPAFFGFPIDLKTKQTNPNSIAHTMLGVDIQIFDDEVSDLDDGVYTILKELGLLCDRDFILSSVHHNGLILKHASDELKVELGDNREFMLAAVRQAGLPALQYASETLQNDKWLQRAATIPLLGFIMQYPKTASGIFISAAAFTIQALTTTNTPIMPKLPIGMNFFDVTNDDTYQNTSELAASQCGL